MIGKIKARILSMTKDDMTDCSSKCIQAKLLDERQNKQYNVIWGKAPTVIGCTGTWSSTNPNAFEKVWEKCNVGDMVWFDPIANYFEPIDSDA